MKRESDDASYTYVTLLHVSDYFSLSSDEWELSVVQTPTLTFSELDLLIDFLAQINVFVNCIFYSNVVE